MHKDINYIVHKKNSSEYVISKFLNGEFSQNYRLVKDKKQYVCSCLSGIYRNYCKHKDWISLLLKHKKLPENVEIEQEITSDETNKLVNSILGE